MSFYLGACHFREGDISLGVLSSLDYIALGCVNIFRYFFL